MATLLGLMLSLLLIRGADRALAMGVDLPTMAFALLDGLIAVTWTLWFIAWMQRHWPAHVALLGKAARASYATYVIHPLVLTAIMVLLPWLSHPGIKFVLVATAGVAACFTLGYLLTRVPGISKDALTGLTQGLWRMSFRLVVCPPALVIGAAVMVNEVICPHARHRGPASRRSTCSPAPATC